MRKIINLNNVDVIIDTDKYKGVWLRGSNGMELFFFNNELASLSRFFNLIPYREDVIFYLKENGYEDRMGNEDYVVAITEKYEALRWDNDDINWKYSLEEAFYSVNYEDYKED